MKEGGYNATETSFEDSIRLYSPGKISKIPGYEEGLFWVQDPSSTLPARLLAPGGDVLELCSAPGGKTCQLYSYGCDVTAVEKSESRAKLLKKNLERVTDPSLEGRVTVLVQDGYGREGRLFDKVRARSRRKAPSCEGETSSIYSIVGSGLLD